MVASGETLTDPEVAPPVENPVPLHEVAFDELHESVELFPDWMLDGEAVRLAAGSGRGLTVSETLSEAEPPGPVQVTVNV